MEVRKAIYHIFKKHGMGEKFTAQEPLFVWDEVSGKSVGNFTQPLLVKGQTLHVGVPNHAVQHELNMLKEKYIHKMNRKLGREELKDIKFKVTDTSRGDMEPDRGPEVDEIPLTEKEEAQIKSILSDLEQGRLKESFDRFFSKLKRIEKTREKLGWKRCKRCGVYHKDENPVCPSCCFELSGYHSR